MNRPPCPVHVSVNTETALLWTRSGSVGQAARRSSSVVEGRPVVDRATATGPRGSASASPWMPDERRLGAPIARDSVPTGWHAQQPIAHRPVSAGQSQRPPRRREQLQLAVSTRRRPERQELIRTPVVAIGPARKGRVSHGLSRSIEPAFLPRQAVQNLPLPAFLDALDPDR